MGTRGRMLLLAGALSGVSFVAARADLPVAPGTVRLDGLAAVVETDSGGKGAAFILRSDVELRARLKLSGQAQDVVLDALPEGLLGATLDELIGEVLIEREAARLGLDAPSEARVREQRRALFRMAGGEARMKTLARALGVGRREVQAIARRRATVAGFLEANLVGTAEITTAELEHVYAAGEHPFADRPLPEVRQQLRAWIGRERTRCAVQRWVHGLRAKAEVRLLVSYGREPSDDLPDDCDVVESSPVREVDEPAVSQP